MIITKGKIHRAQKVTIYGPEGIGKTSLAAQFPEPLFCDTEGGSHELNVARTPTPTSWTMLMEIAKEIAQNPGLCKTFVLDTADWAERLCVQHVCSVHDQKGIESFGYGKGYVYVYEAFGQLLDLLTTLTERGVNVVVTAHSQLRKFEQPDELGSYDRYELKLSKKTGAQVADMLKEWCDLLLFMNYRTIVVNVDGQGALKGKNKAQGGERVMYTTHTPSWDAKNRHGLPDELPADYDVIARIFAGTADNAASPHSPETVAFAQKVQQAAEKVLAAPSAPTPAPVPPPERPAPETVAAVEQLQRETEKPQAVAEVPGEDGIPAALRDLMAKHKVTEQEIMYVVAQKGYYPGGTPVINYDPAFVKGVLIGAWPQVEYAVLNNREDTPF